MAQITIPKSIAGINLPDFSINDSPLIDLFGVEKNFFLQYPRDLGSETKAHSVIFTIYEVKEYTLEQIEGLINNEIEAVSDWGASNVTFANFDDLLSTGGDLLSAGWNALVNADFSQIENINSKDVFGKAKTTGQGLVSGAFKGAKASADIYTNFGKVMTEQKMERIGNIALYMPENFNISDAFNYDDSSSIASAAGAIPIVGKYINRGTNFISGSSNDFVRMMMNKGGFVFNPQKQILFNGVEFRNFSMSFTFTPYSEKENREIKEIIKNFRMWAAPKPNNALGEGMFWTPPAIFEIDFKFHNAHNVNLPKLKRCVIKSVDVNYAPNGWAAHGDGAPVQTVVNIEFQETSLINRYDIGTLGF